MLGKMFMNCLLLFASLLLIAEICSAASIREVGGTRNGYFTSGRQLQFNCEYDNNAFTFRYFGHNGSRLQSSGRYFIQNSNTHYSLVVSDTVPSDGGTWSCTLRSNENLHSLTRTTRTMYEETIVLASIDSSIVGAYQQPFTMNCSGDNIRMWEWISNGNIVTNSSDGRVQVWSNGRLHFTSLQYGDGGIYYCRASNFYDINKYATYRLTVNALPVVRIVKQPSNVIKANDSLNITCMASGVGLQSVTWSKESDGAQLNNNNDHRVIRVFKNDTTIISVLQFSAVTGSQQDTYRCNAISTAGSNYELTEISLSGLPGAPPPPILSVINVTMVMVRWQVPDDTGNLDISHYEISYGKVREDYSRLMLPAHHMEHVFSLLLATSYYFTVAAVNEHGRGPFSQQSIITTNSTIASALSIMVTNVTTNAVLLSWQPLTGNDTGGSPITGYMITYYYMSSESVETKSIAIDDIDNDSYWLTELMDNKQYHVTMCAMNINGCGEQSSLIDFITPLSLPDTVNELKAERRGDGKSITISWTADVADQQLLYYLITIASQDIMISYNFTISMITSNGMIHSVNVDELGLDECYEITVTVTAVNEMGNSTPEIFNITCDDPVNIVSGNISASKDDDDQLSSSMIITIAVPAVVLLILVIVVVALSIYILRRCRRYKEHDMEVGNDYNSKKRDSESSTVPLNYHRNDSIETQDSVGSQLSTPRTVDSFMSENMPFRMSTNGPLDPIKESPSFDERPRQPTPEDGRVMWTVGPAASNNDVIFDYDDEPRSPMTTMDPTQPFIDDDDDEQMVYTDNAAYFSVSHESNVYTAPPPNYSGVKILSDNKNDGKEVVILPEKR